jgi:hypothetical protein
MPRQRASGDGFAYLVAVGHLKSRPSLTSLRVMNGVHHKLNRRSVNRLSTFLHQTERMAVIVHPIASVLLKTGLALLVLNEVRGIVLAVPVLFAMYESGGTLMAVWLGFCSLGGITLSVVAPVFLARKLRLSNGT